MILYFIQHSHIDIGYTDRQERIAGYHAQFTAQAVRHALDAEARSRRDATTQFKFTFEGFWAIERYLDRFGEDGERRLVEAFRTGALDMGPFLVHTAELLDQGHLRDSLRPALAFARRHGISMTAAMASDINGFSWGMADALAETGVEYLITNLNTHHGAPPLGKPLVPFVWESPSGRRLTVWNGLAYHKGNLLGLVPGFCPNSDPGIPGMIVKPGEGSTFVEDISFAEERVIPMVAALREGGYPYDFFPVLAGGAYTDNNPVVDSPCELIAAWNRAHGREIEIRVATLAEFFEGSGLKSLELPVHRGDWPDWWTDGVMCTPFETKLHRNAQRTKRLVEALDPEGRAVTEAERDAIARSLVLYAEHTWGHSASHSAPWSFAVQQLLARKVKNAITADELASTAYDKVCGMLGEGEFTAPRPFAYRVVNPHPFEVTGLAYLPVDFWELSAFSRGLEVLDAEGRIQPHQRTTTLRGVMVATLLTLPAKGSLDLSIRPAEAGGESGSTPADEELMALDLAAPVYQVFPGGQRSEAAGFGYTARRKPAMRIVEGRRTGRKTLEDGPLFRVEEVSWSVEGTQEYRVKHWFYRDLPQVDIAVEVSKTSVRDPEGLYARFAIEVPEGVWRLDKAGGPVVPGRDQIPGTCCDYYAVDRGLYQAGPKGGLSLAAYDSPLVSLGRIKLWDYTTDIEPTGSLYSWLTNNKWETNFKAECGGLYEFRYRLRRDSRWTGGEGPERALAQDQADLVCFRL